MSARGRRRGLVLGTGAAAVVIGAGAAAAVGFGGSATPGPEHRDGLPPATATAAKTTLTETEKVSGTLGYGDEHTLAAHAKGTLTWLPAPGAVVGRGQPIYKVDAVAVPVLYGTVPPYRVLQPGVEGDDVQELEQNLSALGYTGFTVDDEFTADTADAVRAWQDDLGRPESGRVAPSDVVVLSGAARIADVKAAPGDPAGGPVLTYTGTTRTVTIALDVAKQNLVKKGIAATITLPDGSTVTGTVARVGTVATAPPSSSQQGSDKPTTVDVTVTVADQKKLGTLDAAPVDVTLVSETKQNVVAVPVGALVALSEGGFGVQVVEGTQTRFVAVRTGLFADGKVEVTGIAPGTVVGVPQ